MQNHVKILFSLLRSAIRGCLLSEAERASYTEDCLSQLMETAKAHDIAQLVAVALDLNDLPGKHTVENQIMNALMRYERLQYSCRQVCDLLETESIPHMPLKGTVIRQYYREPWLRTSCDIDILVHEEDLERAVCCLEKQLMYSAGVKGTHDVSLYTPDQMHIELHYNLIEDADQNSAGKVLETVWTTARIGDPFHCRYEMPDEMFYFYHIAHMAKHFACGGCGIRPFIDLWILDHIEGADQEKRDLLLGKGNLIKFAQTVRNLSKAWFEDGVLDETAEKMQNVILSGGVYGSSQNRVALQQTQKGGRFRYLLSRIFVPFSKLKGYYPILRKYPWLMPVMQVRRWFMLLNPDVAKRAKGEISANRKIEKSTADEMQAFLKDIGLQ